MPMKKLVFTLFAFALTFQIAAQESTEKDVKVQIFTQEEKDNLQLWYHEGLEKMGLSEETEARYQSILTYYAVKMTRLDDKDQDYTPEEFKTKLNAYLARQDADLREILTDEQFAIHQEIYGEFLRSAYKRWGI